MASGKNVAPRADSGRLFTRDVPFRPRRLSDRFEPSRADDDAPRTSELPSAYSVDVGLNASIGRTASRAPETRTQSEWSDSKKSCGVVHGYAFHDARLGEGSWLHRTEIPEAARAPGCESVASGRLAIVATTKTQASLFSRVVGIFSSLVDEVFGEDDRPVRASRRPAKQRARSREFEARYPLVRQDDETGCGVACIAMLAGEDYEDVKKELFASSRKRVFYTNYKDLRRGLERYGLSLEDGRARRFKSFDDIDSNAILAIEQSPPSKSHWHWVVFVRDGRRRYLLDPSHEGIVRTDLRSVRGRTFLRIVEAATRSPAKHTSSSSSGPPSRSRRSLRQRRA